jgi:SAM-dependent methyltransferase
MERSQPGEFAALRAAEDRHFWFSARNHVIGAVVRELVSSLAPGYRVLEVGCGTGNVLRVLEDVCGLGDVIGVELFAEALRYARPRVRCSLVQADALRLPFATRFDVICLFDVLEHLADDAKVLQAMHGQLNQCGRLVLTVPAHPALWSYADDYAGHYRRYSSAALQSALTTAGFKVDHLSNFMAPLVPLLWLRRRLSALLNRGDSATGRTTRELALNDLSVVPVLNGCLARLLALEAPLLARRKRVPVGTSLLAVATRAQSAGPRSRVTIE